MRGKGPGFPGGDGDLRDLQAVWRVPAPWGTSTSRCRSGGRALAAGPRDARASHSGQAVRGGTQGFPTWSCLPLDPIWRPLGEGTQAWATRVPRTELTWPPSGHPGDSVLPFPDAKRTPDFCHLEDAGARAEIPLCSEKNTTSGPSAPSVGTSSAQNVWACVRACV